MLIVLVICDIDFVLECEEERVPGLEEGEDQLYKWEAAGQREGHQNDLRVLIGELHSLYHCSSATERS